MPQLYHARDGYFNEPAVGDKEVLESVVISGKCCGV
jgi:hypothetical protein